MPKKSLGQHFLKNKSAIRAIISALDLKNGETVIEIGPGKGALTLPLIEKCQVSGIKCQVIAIEKDRGLANQLMSYASATVDQFEILAGDALKILPNLTHQLKTDNWKLVGNIPYYITGKLLRVLSELKNKPALTILTIQREVAERICAHPPGTSPTHRKCSMCGMNLLAAATQFWAEPKILMNLKSADFDPPPTVESSVIKLTTTIPFALNAIRYYEFIKIAFKQPRKTLLNNLSERFGKNKAEIAKILEQIGLRSDIRPQNLSISDLINLTNFIDF